MKRYLYRSDDGEEQTFEYQGEPPARQETLRFTRPINCEPESFGDHFANLERGERKTFWLVREVEP